MLILPTLDESDIIAPILTTAYFCPGLAQPPEVRYGFYA